jgi:hypothetical protein
MTQSDNGDRVLHHFIGAVVAMTISLALSFAQASAAPIVDPALVGTWQMSVPNPQGTALWIWKINADGTYSFHAEGPGSAPPHSGNFSAAGGQYTLKATTMNWTDSGTYLLVNPAMMQATGRLGTGFWQRAGSTPSVGAAASAATASNVIPATVDWPVSGVPAMAKRALGYVRAKWRPDAVLTAIDVELTAGLHNAESPAGGVSIEFRFYSPSTQQQLTLMTRFARRRDDAGRLGRSLRRA